MAEQTTTSRDATANQITFDILRKRLMIDGMRNKRVSKTYENISGDVEEVKIGQLMGVVAASGNWVICKSAATDGSAVPRGVSISSITEAEDEDTTIIDIVVGGDLNKDLVELDGTDTLDTLVGGIRIEDQLRSNSENINLITVTDHTKYDN